MALARGAIFILSAGFVLSSLLLYEALGRYHNPYPPVTTSLTSAETNLQDVAGVLLGLRRLTADLAWVQTLQYYGTPEAGQSEFEFENGLGNYPRFLALCRHAVRIDPYFTYVYYYGGAVLAWNLNRLSEAEDLLKEGIANNPSEWRLSQYLAGLAYQKNHDVSNLMRFLESVVQDPQCPLIMKALLANLYKKHKLYDKALQLWQEIYNSGDPDYRNRAIAQIAALEGLRKGLDKNTLPLVD